MSKYKTEPRTKRPHVGYLYAVCVCVAALDLFTHYSNGYPPTSSRQELGRGLGPSRLHELPRGLRGGLRGLRDSCRKHACCRLACGERTRLADPREGAGAVELEHSERWLDCSEMLARFAAVSGWPEKLAPLSRAGGDRVPALGGRVRRCCCVCCAPHEVAAQLVLSDAARTERLSMGGAQTPRGGEGDATPQGGMTPPVPPSPPRLPPPRAPPLLRAGERLPCRLKGGEAGPARWERWPGEGGAPFRPGERQGQEPIRLMLEAVGCECRGLAAGTACASRAGASRAGAECMGMLIAGACAPFVRNGHGCAQAGDATGGGAKAAWARWPARPADSMRGGEQQPPPGWARRSGAVGLPRPSTSAVRIPSRLSRSSRVRRDEAPRDSREEPEATRSPSFRIACGGAKCTRKVSLMLSLLLARSLRGWESRGLGSGAAGSLSGGAIGGAGGGTDIDCCLRRVASLAASMKAWGRPCSSLLSATAGCCCAGSLVVAAAAAAPCGDDGAVAAAALLRWLSPLTRPQRKRLARTRSSEQTAMTAAALSMVSHGSASSRSTDTKLPSSSEAA